MSQFIRINSQLDALRMKEFEKKFYEKLSDNVKIVPKVTPFKGINTDLMYIKDNKILFIKFMDTSEEIFSILDEELIEVMNEEFNLLIRVISSHMGIWNKDYNGNEVLPIPKDKYQRFVHMCDYLSSKRFIDVRFDGIDIRD